MLGKRSRRMRRTVSVSLIGPVPASDPCPAKSPAEPGGGIRAVAAPPVGLGVVATLHGSNADSCSVMQAAHHGSDTEPHNVVQAPLHGFKVETQTMIHDRPEDPPPGVLKHRHVNQNTLANPVAHKQQKYGPVKVCARSQKKGSGASAKDLGAGMHFLEACCLCSRKLCHGRDIYMYRGDKPFCSEECRHQQILIDERKEKCSLTALKLGTAPQSAHSNGQSSLPIATSTAAG